MKVGIGCSGTGTSLSKCYVTTQVELQLCAVQKPPGLGENNCSAGKLLAVAAGWASTVASSCLRSTLTRANADYSAAQAVNLCPTFGGISAQDVGVSRDAQWVAYVAYPERTLWRSRVDGSQRLQLTSRPLQVSLPRWSPDGKQIAFQLRSLENRTEFMSLPQTAAARSQ